jgi:hypothetical protein
MKILQWIVAGVLLGVIVSRLRRFVEEGAFAPVKAPEALEAGGAEPVLGYDGMDQETLLEWLPAAKLDSETVEDILRYEEANLCREPVVAVLEEMLG